MEFVMLNEKEFTEFEQNHELGSFYQTVKWGKLKETNGWHYYLVGVKENKKIIAGALILKKNVLSKLSILYSPRGFLLDYNNHELLNFFTKNIKKFAKKHHAIFVKIDPAIIYKERNKDGNLVNNGIDNSNIIDSLKELGFKHNGFIDVGNLQPRFAFTLDLNGKSIDEIYNKMETTTKQMIKKDESFGIKTRVMKKDELNKFKDVMEKTSIRRNFIDRPLEYYKNMLDIFKEEIEILFAEINIEEYLNNLNNRKKEEEKKLDNIKGDLKTRKFANNKKANNKINEIQIIIDSLDKKINIANNMKKDGNVVLLGALMFIFHGKEVLSLFGGAYGEYRDFMPAYMLNWDMIKYAKEHDYAKYNFYGISDVFNNKNENMYGLFEFKKGFDGVVEEYIGEFNLIVSKFWYFVYSFAYNKVYVKLKSLKIKSPRN